MDTAALIAGIKKFQGVLSALALLNINGNLFPKDATVCDGNTYDYIVVGGGSAGAIVAARLVEANFKTLIVEAGGNPSLENQYPGLMTYVKYSRLDWNYTVESDGFVGLCKKEDASLLGKVLGGSGATNFMIYGRGNPRDYEGFYKVTKDSSWKWKNMLKYFKKTENLQVPEILRSKYGKYHSNKGTVGVSKENRTVCDDYLKGFEQAGESVVVDNIGTGMGYSSALYNILDGYRTESACTYLPPLRDNPCLHITRNSLATKIIFDKKKNAVGVEFVKNGNTITVKARKEVIVSAGAIKSAQLLLLSGIGPEKDLKEKNINVISDLPVGKNLKDVVGALLFFKTNRTAKPKPLNPHEIPAPLIVGYSALNKSSDLPDYESLNYIIDDAAFFQAYCGFTSAVKNSICDKVLKLAENNQILATLLSSVTPKSRGQVKLNSTDPFDQPLIYKGSYTYDGDLVDMVEYIKDYIKIERAPHFQSIGLEFVKATDKCNMFTFGSTPYWRCYALCMFEATGRIVGTCSMGAVVDTKLRVLGVKRLRIVDESIIPNTIASALYGAVIAIAEKAVEIIIKENR